MSPAYWFAVVIAFVALGGILLVAIDWWNRQRRAR